jgi:hypothetical protein
VTADRVRAWPAAAYPDLFPPDVTVRVSPDGLAWTTVATQTGLAASPGSPITITFTAVPLRFVELRATRLAHHASGMYYAVLSEVELLTASEPAGTIAASWTAPSDDGPSGNATAYDLRVGTCPFDPATAAPVTTAAPRGGRARALPHHAAHLRSLLRRGQQPRWRRQHQRLVQRRHHRRSVTAERARGRTRRQLTIGATIRNHKVRGA